MRFQVPQFIEVESKIFGQLTLKQFIYLVGGAGIIFILYVIFPLWLVIFISIPVASLAIALAFFKINNQPFVTAIENGLRYFLSGKIFIWKKEETIKRQEIKKEKALPSQETIVPKITQSKLKDLAWSLDIKERVQ